MHKATPDELKSVLMVNRIIWFALVSGVVVFAGIVLFVLAPKEVVSDVEPMEIAGVNLYLAIALAFIVIELPVGVVLRLVLFKRAEINGVVPPQNFTTANIIGWACAEGCAFLCIVMALISGDPVNNIWPAAIPLAVQLAMFPTGRPLYGKRDEYATGSRGGA